MVEVVHPQSGSSSTWILVKLEFGNSGFWGEGKTGVPGEKPLGAKDRTNNKLNPNMVSMLEFEPRPHRLSPLHHPLLLLPCFFILLYMYNIWNIIDIFVVVQFCPWFEFYFLLFQTHKYLTLSYLKKKKIETKLRTKLDHNIFFIKYIFYIHCHFICISIQIIIHEQSL